MTGSRTKQRRQAPGTFQCPACRHTVAVNVEAVVWCLKCGKRMRRAPTAKTGGAVRSGQND